MRKRVYSDLQDVWSWTRRTSFFYREGEKCSQRDADLLRFYLTLLPYLVEDLSSDSSDIRRAMKSLAPTEIVCLDYCKMLKDIASTVRRYLNCEAPLPSYTDLKSVYKEVSGSQYVIVALKRLWHGVRMFDPGASFAVLTIIEFGVKLNMLDLDLVTELTDEYLGFEELIGEWSYLEQDVAPVRAIIREWIGNSPDIPSMVPKHGPGAVSDAPSLRGNAERKSQYFFVDNAIRYGGLDQFLFCPNSAPNRISRLVFVPKSMNTNRTISAEPACLQYLQQGVSSLLMEAYYSRRGRRGIYLSDQSLSSGMARTGSIVGDFSTIDMSSASDSVTWELVKRVFPSAWRRLLYATRSTETELPDGRTVHLRKFAPMGSAVCFPVETLIFGAICEAEKRQCRSRQEWRAYGDDLVVPESYSQQVIDRLNRMNFTVNAKKTFTGRHIHNFREACGGEYLDGFDITPVRLSRWVTWSLRDQFTRQRCCPTDPDKLIGLANRLDESGLFATRRAVLQLWDLHCCEAGQDPWIGLPFGNQTGIHSHSDCLGRRNLSRYNKKYQRSEELLVHPVVRPDDGADDYRYYEWLLRYSRFDCTAEEAYRREPVRVGALRTRSLWSWVEVR